MKQVQTSSRKTNHMLITCQGIHQFSPKMHVTVDVK